MPFSQRPFAAARAVIVAAFVLNVCAPASSEGQQPEPLRLSSPPAHSLHFEPLAQSQVQPQTAQGELLDVDGKAQTLKVKTQVAEMTFRYNEHTKVTGAQKGITGLATMAGAQVRLVYKKDGSDNVATEIDVKTAK